MDIGEMFEKMNDSDMDNMLTALAVGIVLEAVWTMLTEDHHIEDMPKGLFEVLICGLIDTACEEVYHCSKADIGMKISKMLTMTEALER